MWLDNPIHIENHSIQCNYFNKLPWLAADAAPAAPAPPPFSGPATPSAINMLSKRRICGSGGSSSCVLRRDRTKNKNEKIEEK